MTALSDADRLVAEAQRIVDAELPKRGFSVSALKGSELYGDFEAVALSVLQQAQAQTPQGHAELEWIAELLAGREVSDFALSFPVVRAVADLREQAQARPEMETLREAARELRINANRLCDRNQGGTYEEDCRRSIERVDVALRATEGPSRGTSAACVLGGLIGRLEQCVERGFRLADDEGCDFWINEAQAAMREALTALQQIRSPEEKQA